MEPLRTAAPDVPGIVDLVEVGRGGAGVVYRGRQVGLARDVAVKVVLAHGAPEAAVRRWRREVTAMARLSGHPGIVAVYDGGVTDAGLPYLVMPYLPGGSLADRLAAGGPLAADAVRTIGAALADALGTAHDAGVLHRDVKPANVLLGARGEPQLVDFGIAQLADATATMTARVHATVAFAPPEVLSGQGASAASDVYSLGATLHACLTGEPPHGSSLGVPMVTLAMRVVHEPPADLRAAGVDPALAGVVDRAMAKDPADRWPDARAMGAALEALAGGDGGRVGDDAPGGAAWSAGPEEPRWAGDPTRPAPAGVAGPTGAAAPVAPPPPVDPGPTVVSPATDPGPQPVPVASPAADAPSPPAGEGSGRRRGPLLLVGLLVVLLVAGAAIALGGGDGAEEAGGGSTTAAPTSAPTTTAEPAAPVAGGDLASAALGYVGALQAGDLEGAYAMTTEGFRAAQPFGGYVDFWGGFGSIAVEGDPGVDEAAGTVTLRLLLDGAGETYTLELVRADGGGWLVDGPRPR